MGFDTQLTAQLIELSPAQRRKYSLGAFLRAIQRVSLDPFSAATDRPVPADYPLRGPSSCPRIRCPRKSSAVDWRKRLKVDMGWRLEVVDRSSQP
jgi:hypothetical protein